MPTSTQPPPAGPGRSRRSFVLLLAGLALGGSASRALARQDGGGSIADEVGRLKPGEFLWAPEVAPAGPVLVVVSLANQRAYVYRNGVLIGISTCSTGKAGHDTPTGVFTILQKQVDHKSNLYDDAPMPFMQRLTWTGVAMHAGNLPGYPASHGCIRLPLAFAENLYGISRLGMTVVIMAGAAVPRIAPSPDMLAGAPGLSPDAEVQSTWQPERAPSGPVSIVISGADRRMLVLRDGIVIGSSAIGFRAPVARPAAFSLVSIAADGLHWVRLPLLGDQAAGAEATTENRAYIIIPDGFRAAVRAILRPGDTLVLTPDTLQAGGAGRQLTILTGE